MAQAAKPLKFFTAAEYLAWEEAQPERHELVEGVPYAMAGDSRVHNLLVGNLYALLRPHARARGCRLYTETVKLRIGENTFYYPDLMLVCVGAPPHTHYEESPCLLVEVVSDSTEGIDRREKLWRYLKLPSLQAYLLVDNRQPRVEAYFRGPEGWLYQALGPEMGEGGLGVPCLGVGLSLEEIYEGVELKATS
ncbi:Uma2 family endonuclease [Thermus antranikianii]|uniref:Uma2 family endonuclease n=1 Tax=Thermus antranikianii TaxID=88190 RepID=A0ABY7RQQ9_9DEIN|nr:Uma2 family endonuclease [Thermus antranikianii]WCM40024.1 Uma2 family endonuclease [Thermus antranikianii]